MHICLVGNPEDLNAVYLGWQAEQRGFEVLHLPERDFGLDWWVDWEDDNPARGVIGTSTGEIQIDELAGAIVRFEPSPALADEVSLEPELAVALIVERRAALQHWLNYLTCVVVNRPATGRANGSKPFQMRRLATVGLNVPAWRLTSDVDAARSFSNKFSDGVVAKSPSGLRSQVRHLSGDLLDRLAGGTTPVLLQAFVSGTDVRVHVVSGDNRTKDAEIFATEIYGGKGVDYRFETEDRSYKALDLPQPLALACARAAASEGLVLAGLDFKLDSEGTFWCLEMNPVPTFLPYEASTGQPIAAAVLDRVTSGT